MERPIKSSLPLLSPTTQLPSTKMQEVIKTATCSLLKCCYHRSYISVGIFVLSNRHNKLYIDEVLQLPGTSMQPSLGWKTTADYREEESCMAAE